MRPVGQFEFSAFNYAIIVTQLQLLSVQKSDAVVCLVPGPNMEMQQADSHGHTGVLSFFFKPCECLPSAVATAVHCAATLDEKKTYPLLLFYLNKPTVSAQDFRRS